MGNKLNKINSELLVNPNSGFNYSPTTAEKLQRTGELWAALLIYYSNHIRSETRKQQNVIEVSCCTLVSLWTHLRWNSQFVIISLSLAASVRVIPSSTQFFSYQSVNVSCGEQQNSTEWKVKRNTSTQINQECSVTWGKRTKSHCFIEDVYPSDTGVYWCESGAGECSNTVNITVTGGFNYQL